MDCYYAHLNINSPDWERLAKFYVDVFDCKIVPPIRHIHGKWFEKASGLKGAEVHGVHLALPGYGKNGPTLEILTNKSHSEDCSTAFTQKGFGHIAFHVDDVKAVYEKLLAHGGSAVGEIATTEFVSLGKTLTIVYAKDPDGNIVEIQNWTEHNQYPV